MKKTALFCLVFLLFCALSFSAASDGEDQDPASGDDDKAIVDHASSAQEGDSDDFLEINPNYVGPPTDEENDDDDKDAIEEVDAKSAIGKVLGFQKTLPRKMARFLKKHKLTITLALVLLAFRREIFPVLWQGISQPVRDPETGSVVGRALHVSPTGVLKVLLFVHFMRLLQKMGNGNKISPSTVLLLGRLTGNPGIALILSSFLAPSNQAYLPPVSQHYTFEQLNGRYSKDSLAYSKALGETKKTAIQMNFPKSRTASNATKSTAAQFLQTAFLGEPGEMPPSYNGTIVVMDWTGLDSSVSRLDVLRDEVSFLITCQEERKEEDESINSFEVVVLLESPGGSASDYALAAQQILRLRNQGINVTVCVDKVAASGGYMIACTSSPGRLFAAPFAVVGSIGVIGQSVNIHKVLEGWGVTPMVFRGGRDKAPVGLIGEVTKEGMEKVQLMVDDTHRAFKRHVANSRPLIASRIEEIATGDIWLGYDALEVGLIDRIVTSDEYLGERIRNGARVLKLYRIVQSRGIFSRPSTAVSASFFNSDAKHSLADNRSVLSLLSELRSFLGRAQEAVGGFLSDDFSSLTRATGIRDVRTSSSM